MNFKGDYFKECPFFYLYKITLNQWKLNHNIPQSSSDLQPTENNLSVSELRKISKMKIQESEMKKSFVSLRASKDLASWKKKFKTLQPFAFNTSGEIKKYEKENPTGNFHVPNITSTVLDINFKEKG